MPELCDFDVEVAEAGAHHAPDGAHAHKDGNVPQVVEHAGAVEGQAVGVQPKVAVPSEVRLKDLPRMLLSQYHAPSNSVQATSTP